MWEILRGVISILIKGMQVEVYISVYVKSVVSTEWTDDTTITNNGIPIVVRKENQYVHHQNDIILSL